MNRHWQQIFTIGDNQVQTQTIYLSSQSTCPKCWHGACRSSQRQLYIFSFRHNSTTHGDPFAFGLSSFCVPPLIDHTFLSLHSNQIFGSHGRLVNQRRYWMQQSTSERRNDLDVIVLRLFHGVRRVLFWAKMVSRVIIDICSCCTVHRTFIPLLSQVRYSPTITIKEAKNQNKHPASDPY